MALEREGLKVLAARNSIEALVIAADYPLAIDVLTSCAETRAGGHNGVELASCFRILRPETRIILTSKPGVGMPSAVTEFEGEIQYLAVPFKKEKLMEIITRPTSPYCESAQAA